jgi:hypothetical protein
MKRTTRRSIYHDPITEKEIEAVDALILRDEGHIGFVNGREMRHFTVKIPGLGETSRNILLPTDDPLALGEDRKDPG